MKPLQAIKVDPRYLGVPKTVALGIKVGTMAASPRSEATLDIPDFNRACGIADLAATNHRVELAERQFNHVVRLDDVYLPLS